MNKHEHGKVHLILDSSKERFHTSGTVTGLVQWSLPVVDTVTVSLIWYTSGSIGMDGEVVDSVSIKSMDPTGETRFELDIPSTPHTYAGNLFAVNWAIEAVTNCGAGDLVEISVKPNQNNVGQTDARALTNSSVSSRRKATQPQRVAVCVMLILLTITGIIFGLSVRGLFVLGISATGVMVTSIVVDIIRRHRKRSPGKRYSLSRELTSRDWELSGAGLIIFTGTIMFIFASATWQIGTYWALLLSVLFLGATVWLIRALALQCVDGPKQGSALFSSAGEKSIKVHRLGLVYWVFLLFPTVFAGVCLFQITERIAAGKFLTGAFDVFLLVVVSLLVLAIGGSVVSAISRPSARGKIAFRSYPLRRGRDETMEVRLRMYRQMSKIIILVLAEEASRQPGAETPSRRYAAYEEIICEISNPAHEWEGVFGLTLPDNILPSTWWSHNSLTWYLRIVGEVDSRKVFEKEYTIDVT